MSIPDRFARIARHKFNEIKDRIDQWDSEAEERADAKTRRESDVKSEASKAKRELDDSLEQPCAFAKESDGTRPAPRTPAEIARGVSNPNYAPQSAEPQTAGPLGRTLNGANNGANGTQEGDALDYHYRLLGLEPGADFSAVETAYNKLAARCDPARFPAGSTEVDALRKKLQTSFEVLRDALDVTALRFGLLDFDDTPIGSPNATAASTLEL